MGMSASQARYMALTAELSNTEYQGQQINQARSILSKQCTELYDSLLSMTVPTPPATTDFQMVKYTGQVGASKYAFDANSVKPQGKDTYSVTLQEKAHGDSLSKDPSLAVVSKNAKSGVRGQLVTKITEIVEQDGKKVKIGKAISEDTFNNLYVVQKDGTIVKATTRDVKGDGTANDPYRYLNTDPPMKYFVKKANGADIMNTRGSAGGTVSGQEIFELNAEQKTKYGPAIAQSGLKDSKGQPYTVDDFYIYFDDEGKPHFTLKVDVDDGNDNAVTYGYIPNGEYEKDKNYKDVKLTFDPTNGRITSIALPVYSNGTSEPSGEGDQIASYTEIAVKAETVADEKAYQDAFNKYEYDTHIYEQKNKEINAKTAVIQEEDKNLELKLKRCDDKRNQIKTEMEAVKKVIGDSIEGGYKTFSG